MAEGQMTLSTYLDIDGLPARVETLETIVGNIPITYQTIDNANAQNAALVDVINSGAKNKLNVFAAPAQTQPINGITWTVNSDGTVTANGTASGNSWFYLTANPANIKYGVATVLSGCPEGGSATTWEIQCSMVGDSARSDYGEGMIQPHDYSYRYIACCVRNGQTVTNLTFKPMVCAKTLYDITDAFVPYSPTNAELYQMLTSGTRSLSMSAAPQTEPEQEER
jgi:hypothetical protein